MRAPPIPILNAFGFIVAGAATSSRIRAFSVDVVRTIINGGTMRQPHPTRSIALLVEADQELRALVATLLEESELDVIECDSAEAALAVVEMKGDDMAMVVTDVALAGRLDGVELAQSLEAQHPDVPVIVMSQDSAARASELPHNVIQLGERWRPLDVLIAAERARRAA
jgi:CheY-like chemotaxis protein